MRMIHNYDIYGNTESAIIYLAKPGKRFFCALGGIDTSTVSVTLRTNNTAELTFTVDKYVDGVESQGYEELDEMMELYCDGIWYKIMILQQRQMTEHNVQRILPPNHMKSLLLNIN